MSLTRQEQSELLRLLEKQKEKPTTEEVVSEVIREFAELNLEIVKELRSNRDYNHELLKELRENAQALIDLV